MSKQQVDTLLTHGYLITMDSQTSLEPDGAVAVNGNTIIAVGPTATLEAAYEATEVIDCHHCIISPGLVNAHTHAAMTLLRGLADDLRLDVWLYGYMMPVEREFVDHNFCYTGTLLACAEMIRSGVTTFCDMYYHEAEVARATAEAGVRAILAQTILKFPSPDATSYDESLDYCRWFIQEWRNHPLIIPAVAPHAPYTATPDMIRSCVALALEFDVPLHIHVAETELEQKNSEQEYGATVVPWLDACDLFKAKVIAAHCVHLKKSEMRTFHQHQVGVAHCPSSNLKLGSGVAPIQRMVKMGLPVGIGTDGPASNNDLDMFEETRLASFLQKGVFGDPTALPAKTTWALATCEGARAIHLNHLIGSLEPGKRADIVVIAANNLHQLPNFTRDPEAVYARLVYATKATDVRDVMIDGKLLMRDRRLLYLDEAAILAEGHRIARRVDSFLIAREGNILSKILAVSADVIPEETFEIQVKARLPEFFEATAAFKEAGINLLRPSTRDQIDTYFFFEEGHEADRLRFREDTVQEERGKPKETFFTMTLMGPTSEKEFENSILLTRGRYTASARQSLRFYREYFRPVAEREVHKDRLHCHTNYKGTDFIINLDKLPDLLDNSTYLEIKSRTWSAKDALHKADLIGELLHKLGVKHEDQLKIEYINLVAQE
jgi:5-methylthioadenosine/S-adenosylhomocysteine deaminase